MIGTCRNGKTYIGSDLNKTHIIESKEVIRNLNLQNAKVFVQDILVINNESQYECLFTCPPYADKEQWNGCNDTTKSCDEWIDICLEKFNCKAYLFVVDTTEKYKEYVVDTIENRSHFGVNVEKVILIKK